MALVSIFLLMQGFAMLNSQSDSGATSANNAGHAAKTRTTHTSQWSKVGLACDGLKGTLGWDPAMQLKLGTLLECSHNLHCMDIKDCWY